MRHYVDVIALAALLLAAASAASAAALDGESSLLGGGQQGQHTPSGSAHERARRSDPDDDDDDDDDERPPHHDHRDNFNVTFDVVIVDSGITDGGHIHKFNLVPVGGRGAGMMPTIRFNVVQVLKTEFRNGKTVVINAVNIDPTTMFRGPPEKPGPLIGTAKTFNTSLHMTLDERGYTHEFTLVPYDAVALPTIEFKFVQDPNINVTTAVPEAVSIVPGPAFHPLPKTPTPPPARAAHHVQRTSSF